MKCSFLLHFIWVFTVCQIIRLGVTSIEWVKWTLSLANNYVEHARIQKVLSEGGGGGGPTLTTFFFFILFFFFLGGGGWWREEERIQISLKAGDHRPTKETPFKWRFAVWPIPIMAWGSGPILLRNPIFCDCSGGSGPPSPPPSGSAHVETVRMLVAYAINIKDRICWLKR